MTLAIRQTRPNPKLNSAVFNRLTLRRLDSRSSNVENTHDEQSVLLAGQYLLTAFESFEFGRKHEQITWICIVVSCFVGDVRWLQQGYRDQGDHPSKD